MVVQNHDGEKIVEQFQRGDNVANVGRVSVDGDEQLLDPGQLEYAVGPTLQGNLAQHHAVFGEHFAGRRGAGARVLGLVHLWAGWGVKGFEVS